MRALSLRQILLRAANLQLRDSGHDSSQRAGFHEERRRLHSAANLECASYDRLSASGSSCRCGGSGIGCSEPSKLTRGPSRRAAGSGLLRETSRRSRWVDVVDRSSGWPIPSRLHSGLRPEVSRRWRPLRAARPRLLAAAGGNGAKPPAACLITLSLLRALGAGSPQRSAWRQAARERGRQGIACRAPRPARSAVGSGQEGFGGWTRPGAGAGCTCARWPATDRAVADRLCAARRAVACFGDDQLGCAGCLLGVCAVQAVQQQHAVCVLFDRAAVAQIGQMGAAVGPALALARELAGADQRDIKLARERFELP